MRLTIEEEVILEYWVDGGLDKSRALDVKKSVRYFMKAELVCCR